MKGIGGQLPNVTKCYNVAPVRTSLTDDRVVRALFVFVVLAVLGLGHIYLRFSVKEMKLQHKEYQRTLLQLRQQAGAMQRENETLCDISRLHEFGLHELRMIDVQPETAVTVSLDPAMRSKYLPEGYDAGDSDSIIVSHQNTTSEQKGTLHRIAARLFEPDRAFAGENKRVRK